MKVTFIDKIVVFLLSIILLVDSINGFLLLNKVNTSISLSQLVKFPILFFMLFRIFLLNRKYSLHIFSIVFILLTSVFVNYFQIASINFIAEFTLILKLMVIPVCLYYFVCLKNINSDFYNNSVSKIFKIAFIVLFVNIFLSFVGVGYSSYSGGIGNKGFFYAGNELSAMYLVINSYLLLNVYQNYQRKYFYLLSVIAIALGLLISTKVSMISILFIVLLIPLTHLKLKITPKLIRNSVFFLLAIVLFTFILIENVRTSGVYARWVYFFKIYDYDFISILLSGRNITLTESWNMNAINFEPLNAFFGYSYTGFIDNLRQSSFFKAKANEMDFIDLYFMYGILGLFSVLSVWFIAIYNYFISSNKNIILLITILLILFISFISGHILYSGLSGPFIGIYLSQFFTNSNTNFKA